jgi:mRNA-degrading endonuclease RelE of RelBE toxin-antitoxin system
VPAWRVAPSGVAYRIDYDPEAVQDLLAHRGAGAARVRDAVTQHLTHEPTRRTRNRFPAAPNSLGTWELRAPPYRVYYDVDEAPQRVVVRAVLLKERERAYRRGQRIDTHE